MFKINKKILERKLKYKGEVVLTYYIEYPQIISNYANMGIQKFNLYNQRLAIEIKNKSEGKLYREAVQLYRYNKENGYPIMEYEVYRTYEITLNTNSIISLYADEYIFSGGAHGNTIRSSQNWNIKKAKMLQLSDFYKNNPYFILDILKQICEQISNNPEIYFKNTCELVVETFNPKSFYLTPKGLVIYFQQYDIAPYSSGIIEFEINN